MDLNICQKFNVEETDEEGNVLGFHIPYLNLSSGESLTKKLLRKYVKNNNRVYSIIQ